MASKGGSLLGDLLVAQLFEGKKDNAFYLVEDLQQLAQVAGIAKTRIRFFWQQKANGELVVTDTDKRFYTREIREFERFRNLGIADSQPITDRLADHAIWNNTHIATLEDYQIYEKAQPLYTPEAEEAYVAQQMEENK